MFRKSVRKFVENEVEWKNGKKPESPRWLFKRCGELGYLGLTTQYGSAGLIMEAVFIEEFAKCGSGGVGAGLVLFRDRLDAPFGVLGADKQKKENISPGIRGELICRSCHYRTGCRF